MSARRRGKTTGFVATLVTGLIAVVCALTGCTNHHHTSGRSGSDQTSPADFPATVAPPGGQPVTLEKRPEKIVSLSPADTEILLAIGAGVQVVAVDRLSDYPASAPHSTLDGTQPNIEAIAGYQPDLVIASNDPGGLVSGLSRIKVPVLLTTAPNTLDTAYAEWSLIGKATGHATQADGLVRRSKDEIAKIVHDAAKPGRTLSYYHELDQTLYTVTSRTFIGNVYSLLGLRNIADAADSASANGYPQLSAEQVIKANPDLIFLADGTCCGQNAATIGARPGWSTLTAVRSGDVVMLDDAESSRWGPRIVDLIRTVSDAVAKAARRNG